MTRRSGTGGGARFERLVASFESEGTTADGTALSAADQHLRQSIRGKNFLARLRHLETATAALVAAERRRGEE